MGTRTRKDGATVNRYGCVSPAGDRHYFSECFEQSPLPAFPSVKCPNKKHRGSRVTRKGTSRKGGSEHQRYLCRPLNGDDPHRFTLELPRVRVVNDPNWEQSDAVLNPHRGATASGRGHTATMSMVAEGLQMLSLGKSYSKVGKWAASQRPGRALTKGAPAKNYWQTGADWTELYTPVLWDAWQKELAGETAGTLPSVLVIDDKPVYGGATPAGQARGQMVFSILVAIEYYQPDPLYASYAHRVRLIRAYPHHRASAYELLIRESGVNPDVIVSDSSSSIWSAVQSLRKTNPNLRWTPSSYHIVKQLRKALAKMTNAKTNPLHPGKLAGRMESFALLGSPEAWEKWWDDLERAMNTDRVPLSRRPNRWRRDYYQRIYDALTYLEDFPKVPRGNGAVESSIFGAAEPFFNSRAPFFTNIERLNRAADLLTLQLNGRMDSVKTITTLLEADALSGGGYVPPARQVTDPHGYASLYDDRIIDLSLSAAKARK